MSLLGSLPWTANMINEGRQERIDSCRAFVDNNGWSFVKPSWLIIFTLLNRPSHHFGCDERNWWGRASKPSEKWVLEQAGLVGCLDILYCMNELKEGDWCIDFGFKADGIWENGLQGRLLFKKGKRVGVDRQCDGQLRWAAGKSFWNSLSLFW